MTAPRNSPPASHPTPELTAHDCTCNRPPRCPFARLSRSLPLLRRAHAAGARVGRRVSRPLPRDVDRPHARGTRTVAADARPRSRPRAARRVGRRQHARERALRARASRWRSPRTCCGCTSRPDDAASSDRRRPPWSAARLRDVRFYVLPRMSPDGAEAVLANGRYVRSVPRDERPARAHAYWRCDDVDGDGLALAMRVRDPGGEMVESPEFPGLLLPRTIDDPPPYYKVYPEGVIENFDGSNVPSPHFLSDNQTDLNRNFPVLLGAGLEAGGRRRVSAERGRVARRRRVHDAASGDLPLAQPAHVRRRVHPPARRQARHAR